MKKTLKKANLKNLTLNLLVVIATTLLFASCSNENAKSNDKVLLGSMEETTDEGWNTAPLDSYTEPIPVYSNWKHYTTKDGLPSDKAYAVRAVGDKVWVGTHDGLSVLENGEWTTYTTEDGLPHNGVVAIDVCEETGDVWIGTLGGLSRFAAGKFENFDQLNSGLPNDLVYSVICSGKDIWTATGGGAGHYDSYAKKWEIFTEQNAPMHEPWTYGVSAGDGKIFIAAWGGGLIEYDPKKQKFKDYTDPDGEFEIDLLPNDGIVHDITTATSYGNGVLWVSTYFGLSRYDGTHWNGYFDHDSGLASNFINFIRTEGAVVYVCSDNGLSCTNGKDWVTYKKNDNSVNGKAILTTGAEKTGEVNLSPSISHNFIIGVDVEDDKLWVATSKGVSCGELVKL
jgi:ligand-binding sensor domain-containing protein